MVARRAACAGLGIKRRLEPQPGSAPQLEQAHRLPATEQLALGGDEFGRAYEASVIAGDYGLAGSAELALAPKGLPVVFQGSEGYAFADAGKVWYRSRFGFPTVDGRVASVGVGVRAKLANRSLVQLEAGHALENPLPALDRHGWRGVFLVKSVF